MLRVMILIFLLSTFAACEPAAAVCRKSLKDGHMTEECSCPQGKTMAPFRDNRFHCFDRCDICPNGFCSKKVSCHCFNNMEKNSRGICPQICPNCTNGWCSSPFKCECNTGFAGDRCLPVCSSGCPNGYCSAPGVCVCNAGYAFSNHACEKVDTASSYQIWQGIWNRFGWSLFALPPVLLLISGLFAVRYFCRTSRPPRTSEQAVDVIRCPPPDGQSQVPLSVFILN